MRLCARPISCTDTPCKVSADDLLSCTRYTTCHTICRTCPVLCPTSCTKDSCLLIVNFKRCWTEQDQISPLQPSLETLTASLHFQTLNEWLHEKKKSGLDLETPDANPLLGCQATAPTVSCILFSQSASSVMTTPSNLSFHFFQVCFAKVVIIFSGGTSSAPDPYFFTKLTAPLDTSVLPSSLDIPYAFFLLT